MVKLTNIFVDVEKRKKKKKENLALIQVLKLDIEL